MSIITKPTRKALAIAAVSFATALVAPPSGAAPDGGAPPTPSTSSTDATGATVGAPA